MSDIEKLEKLEGYFICQFNNAETDELYEEFRKCIAIVQVALDGLYQMERLERSTK